MQRALVTGGNGFVGRTACAWLRRSGIEITAALRDAAPSPDTAARIVRIPAIDGSTRWTDALAGCDLVLHLAGMAHVADGRPEDVLQCRRVNIDGTLNLARQAAAKGVSRFLFISSVKVMGEGRAEPYCEEDEPAPAGAYAQSKKEAEDGLREIEVKTGMEVVILRPPLVYGPGAKANLVRLIRAAERGWPLPRAAFSNRRSFIYLENLADAIVACLLAPQAAGKTYFLSDGVDFSTSDFLAAFSRRARGGEMAAALPAALEWLLARASGGSAALRALSASFCVDTAAIRRDLGWQPPFAPAEGLRRTLEWYRGGMASPAATRLERDAA